MIRFAKLNACLLAGTAALTFSAQAAAQSTETAAPADDTATEGTGLGDIVVTAQKRAENLQDVPLSVTAIGAEQLTSKGVNSTEDLANVVPGLTINTVAGQSTTRIRGVGAASAQGGNENAVAMYVDGVYIASSSSSLFALNNIAQIAVLKGPQGTLFGRNATGGVIQVITRDPSEETSGSASIGYGNHDRYAGDFYVTGGLAPGVAADLSVVAESQRDGFGRNLTTGNDVNKNNSFSIRSKIAAELGASTEAVLSLDYARTKSFGPARRPDYGSTPVGGVPFTAGKFDTVSDLDPTFTNRQGGVSLKLTHHFDGVDLVSISAYRKAKTAVRGFDIDATRLPLTSNTSDLNDHQYSEELQLVSTGSGPFKWTLGAFYFNAVGAFEDVRLKLPFATFLFDTRQHIESGSIYGQGSYEVTPTTQLTVGLRYSKETRKYAGVGSVIPAGGSTPFPQAPAIGRLSSSTPTWRFAIDQKLSDDVLIYASYNRGFKSGGFSTTRFQAPSISFRPEKIDAYEVGLKSDLLDRVLRVNAAGFYYDYTDIQLNSVNNGLLDIFNAASAKIYGLDLDVTASPIDGLTLGGSLALLHSKLGTFLNAPTYLPLPAGGNSQTTTNATGNKLPSTPDWTLNLSADYSVPVSFGNVTFSASYTHNDGWFAEVDNRLTQKPFDTVNGSILFELGSNEEYSIRLWGRNLTNSVYASQLNSSNFGDIYSPSVGRSYGVTAGFKF